eukprot:gene9432-9597_t
MKATNSSSSSSKVMQPMTSTRGISYARITTISSAGRVAEERDDEEPAAVLKVAARIRTTDDSCHRSSHPQVGTLDNEALKELSVDSGKLLCKRDKRLSTPGAALKAPVGICSVTDSLSQPWNISCHQEGHHQLHSGSRQQAATLTWFAADKQQQEEEQPKDAPGQLQQPHQDSNWQDKLLRRPSTPGGPLGRPVSIFSKDVNASAEQTDACVGPLCRALDLPGSKADSPLNVVAGRTLRLKSASAQFLGSSSSTRAGRHAAPRRSRSSSVASYCCMREDVEQPNGPRRKPHKHPSRSKRPSTPGGGLGQPVSILASTSTGSGKGVQDDWQVETLGECGASSSWGTEERSCCVQSDSTAGARLTDFQQRKPHKRASTPASALGKPVSIFHNTGDTSARGDAVISGSSRGASPHTSPHTSPHINPHTNGPLAAAPVKHLPSTIASHLEHRVGNIAATQAAHGSDGTCIQVEPETTTANDRHGQDSTMCHENGVHWSRQWSDRDNTAVGQHDYVVHFADHSAGKQTAATCRLHKDRCQPAGDGGCGGEKQQQCWQQRVRRRPSTPGVGLGKPVSIFSTDRPVVGRPAGSGNRSKSAPGAGFSREEGSTTVTWGAVHVLPAVGGHTTAGFTLGECSTRQPQASFLHQADADGQPGSSNAVTAVEWCISSDAADAGSGRKAAVTGQPRVSWGDAEVMHHHPQQWLPGKQHQVQGVADGTGHSSSTNAGVTVGKSSVSPGCMLQPEDDHSNADSASAVPLQQHADYFLELGGSQQCGDVASNSGCAEKLIISTGTTASDGAGDCQDIRTQDVQDSSPTTQATADQATQVIQPLLLHAESVDSPRQAINQRSQEVSRRLGAIHCPPSSALAAGTDATGKGKRPAAISVCSSNIGSSQQESCSRKSNQADSLGWAGPQMASFNQILLQNNADLAAEQEQEMQYKLLKLPTTPGAGLGRHLSFFRDYDDDASQQETEVARPLHAEGDGDKQKHSNKSMAVVSSAEGRQVSLSQLLQHNNADLVAEHEQELQRRLHKLPTTPGTGLTKQLSIFKKYEAGEGDEVQHPRGQCSQARMRDMTMRQDVGEASAGNPACTGRASLSQLLLQNNADLAAEQEQELQLKLQKLPVTPGAGLGDRFSIFKDDVDEVTDCAQGTGANNSCISLSPVCNFTGKSHTLPCLNQADVYGSQQQQQPTQQHRAASAAVARAASTVTSPGAPALTVLPHGTDQGMDLLQEGQQGNKRPPIPAAAPGRHQNVIADDVPAASSGIFSEIPQVSGSSCSSVESAAKTMPNSRSQSPDLIMHNRGVDDCTSSSIAASSMARLGSSNPSSQHRRSHSPLRDMTRSSDGDGAPGLNGQSLQGGEDEAVVSPLRRSSTAVDPDPGRRSPLSNRTQSASAAIYSRSISTALYEVQHSRLGAVSETDFVLSVQMKYGGTLVSPSAGACIFIE